MEISLNATSDLPASLRPISRTAPSTLPPNGAQASPKTTLVAWTRTGDICDPLIFLAGTEESVHARHRRNHLPQRGEVEIASVAGNCGWEASEKFPPPDLLRAQARFAGRPPRVGGGDWTSLR